MGAKLHKSGGVIDYTPGTATTAGDVISVGKLLGVADNDIAANKLGALSIAGIYSFAKATGASTGIGAGVEVYYDEDNDRVSTDPGTGEHAFAGITVAAAGDSAATVLVHLNKRAGGPGKGFLNVPIDACKLNTGVAIAVFADGASATPGWHALTSELGGVRWNNHATPTPIGCSLPIPPDLKEGSDIIVHIIAAKTGATIGDATTFTSTTFFNVVGELFDADADAGGVSSAMTGNATAKTVQHETITIAGANVPAGPGSIQFTIGPTAGTLGTDDVILSACYLEYEKAA